jgi:hypothetical protein
LFEEWSHDGCEERKECGIGMSSNEVDGERSAKIKTHVNSSKCRKRKETIRKQRALKQKKRKKKKRERKKQIDGLGFE